MKAQTVPLCLTLTGQPLAQIIERQGWQTNQWLLNPEHTPLSFLRGSGICQTINAHLLRISEEVQSASGGYEAILRDNGLRAAGLMELAEFPREILPRLRTRWNNHVAFVLAPAALSVDNGHSQKQYVASLCEDNLGWCTLGGEPLSMEKQSDWVLALE